MPNSNAYVGILSFTDENFFQTKQSVISMNVLMYVKMLKIAILAPFYSHGLTLIPAWISNYIHYNAWDEITYSFLNFNGATVEV